MKKLIMMLSAVTLLSVPAIAANWVQIGPGHYIDSYSIKPSSQYGTYIFDTKYIGVGQPLEEINDQQIWTINTNSFMDCRNAYAKTLSYSALDRNDKVVMKSKNIEKQWTSINTPDSRAYESYAFICTDKYLNSRNGYQRLWWY